MMPLTGFIQLNTDYTAAMLADVRTSGKTRYYYVVLQRNSRHICRYRPNFGLQAWAIHLSILYRRFHKS